MRICIGVEIVTLSLSELKCPDCGNDLSFITEDIDKNIVTCVPCIKFWNLDD